ncbi:MAG: hypothetical protein HC836_42140 [Richelia sp. RM2_1_2]|nr:hypothetical protein [Richelia sp. RM2_1_2]
MIHPSVGEVNNILKWDDFFKSSKIKERLTPNFIARTLERFKHYMENMVIASQNFNIIYFNTVMGLQRQNCDLWVEHESSINMFITMRVFDPFFRNNNVDGEVIMFENDENVAKQYAIVYERN